MLKFIVEIEFGATLVCAFVRSLADNKYGFISMRLRIENSSSIGITLAPMTSHANDAKSLITREPF